MTRLKRIFADQKRGREGNGTRVTRLKRVFADQNSRPRPPSLFRSVKIRIIRVDPCSISSPWAACLTLDCARLNRPQVLLLAGLNRCGVSLGFEGRKSAL